jgi:hypothetical protein
MALLSYGISPLREIKKNKDPKPPSGSAFAGQTYASKGVTLRDAKLKAGK